MKTLEQMKHLCGVTQETILVQEVYGCIPTIPPDFEVVDFRCVERGDMILNIDQDALVCQGPWISQDPWLVLRRKS